MADKKCYDSILKLIGTGEDNAISLTNLSIASGKEPREVKYLVQKARLDGVLICSTENGYFYPHDIEDIERFYKRFRSSAITTLTVIKHARLELIRNGVDIKELFNKKKEVCKDEI